MNWDITQFSRANTNYRTTPAAAPGALPQSAPAEARGELPTDGFSSTGTPSSGAYSPMSGTSMATPISGGISESLLDSMLESAFPGTGSKAPTGSKTPGEPKMSPDDLDMAQGIKENAEFMGISLQNSMDMFLFGDSAAFQIGMSQDEIKAENAKRRQDHNHIATYLGLNEQSNQQTYANKPIALME